MRIGLQITKNKDKYKKLISLIDCSEIKNISFIHIKNNQSLKKELKSLNILVTYKITPELFRHRSDNLKWIHIGASGIEDNLFHDILKSRVIITNSKGINAKPVAEFIMSQMLYFAKRLNDCNQFKLDKQWNQWELAKKTIQLSDSTLGIIGYGSIGKELAKQAKSLGMQVLATRRLQKTIENKKFVDYLVPTKKINFILKNSHFIAITCPLTPLTKNMINKKSFQIMSKESYLINTSRGGTVDQDALTKALEENMIDGAALDVTSPEPIDPNHPLVHMDNVVMTPHIASASSETYVRMSLMAADNIISFFQGTNMPSCLNPEVLK